MRVHAWSGHFDSSGPVEVEMTQIERKFLDGHLVEIGCVLGHVEVGWLDTALCCGLWYQEEIKFLGIRVLHD